MTRFLPLLLLGGLLAPLALAQSPNSTHAVAWPESDPIWELEIVRPRDSSGPKGSGIEIRDVRYRGQSVMKRGHVPILNVKYEAACNCFRDWQHSEVRFEADNPVSGKPWVAEATPGTVRTMCDAAPGNCTGNTCNDVGSHTGAAIERFEDRLVITTQLSAGWYRYTMRWTFHEDGVIEPLFGFTSTGTSCTTNPRRHHAYWRFDFDINEAGKDRVFERRGEVEIPLAIEGIRSWSEEMPFPGTQEMHAVPLDLENPPSWIVMDGESGRGYALTPSANDLLTPMNPRTGIPALDDFANEDLVVSRYRENELDDGFSSCQANFTGGSQPVINGENVYDQDVVLWYRTGVTKPHSDASTCYLAGPTLTPVGDWSGVGYVDAEEGASPTGFTLEEAFPNPFSRQTTVRFSVEQAQPVTLTLYDALGRAVRTLFEGQAEAGALQSVVLDASDLPSGTYTVRLQGESLSGSTRVTLVR